MNLYSMQDVIEDIQRTEGVEMELPNQRPVSYLKLYSQVHAHPMSNDATLNELNKRVNRFLNNPEYAVPPCDVCPLVHCEEYSFLVYRIKGLPCAIVDSHLEFIAGHQEADDLSKYLSADSNEMAICVIFADTGEVSYHNRKSH
jgi:hypothetical protein